MIDVWKYYVIANILYCILYQICIVCGKGMLGNKQPSSACPSKKEEIKSLTFIMLKYDSMTYIKIAT